MLWLVFIIVSLILVIRRWQMRKVIQLSNKIKCDIQSYPFIGHAHLLYGNGFKISKATHLFGRDAIKQGGMTGLWVGSRYFVVAADAADLEVIMKTSLDKDDIMRFARYFVGNGSIFAPVSIWRPRRKIMTPVFSRYKMHDYIKVFARQSEMIVNNLKSSKNMEIMMNSYASPLTFDTICELALGMTLNTQENPEEPVLLAINAGMEMVVDRMAQPWLYLDAIYNLLPHSVGFWEIKKLADNFVDGVIHSKRKELKNNTELNNNTDKMKSFMEVVIETSGGDCGYNDLELREELLVFLLAASDTTAVGISCALSLLAHYPEVQKKVFMELQGLYGDSTRSVVLEDFSNLKYLDAVIRESMRLYPPVPLIFRKIKEDTKLPSGITLIKDTSVMVHIWATQRNPVYWGDDADQFRPERFLEAQAKHSAAYLAFSHGPRNCIGHQYAMALIKTTVITLLRKYQVLTADENGYSDKEGQRENYRLTSDLLMRDADGYRMKLLERSVDK